MRVCVYIYNIQIHSCMFISIGTMRWYDAILDNMIRSWCTITSYLLCIWDCLHVLQESAAACNAMYLWVDLECLYTIEFQCNLSVYTTTYKHKHTHTHFIRICIHYMHATCVHVSMCVCVRMCAYVRTCIIYIHCILNIYNIYNIYVNMYI